MSTTEIIAVALIKYGPAVARALFDIFSKETVLKEDWDKLFLQVESKTYEDYVGRSFVTPS